MTMARSPSLPSLWVYSGSSVRWSRNQPRNFLIRTGFATRPAENSPKLKRAMFLLAHVRRLLPPLPRDYIRRRRAVRRITNVLLIATLSLISAYFITRPIGGTGFPARNLPASRVPAPTPVIHPPASPPPAAPVPVSRDANGYELEAGPYTVSEAEDLVLRDARRGKELHVRIFYPNPGGKYPVIVFSHGA